MNFLAAIFDLDGTLLDTLGDIADSMNAVLTRMGYPTHPIADYRYFVGDGVDMLIRRVLPPDRAETDDRVTAGRLMREEYGNRWSVRTRPFPGMGEMLTNLAARGLKLAVLSNKDDHFTRQIIAHYFPAGTFAAVAGSKPGIPRKPDPTAALDIARRLEAAPGACLYLGDTNTDMQTAKSAGMFAVGVLWGYRPRAELEASGARRVVSRPADVMGLLG